MVPSIRLLTHWQQPVLFLLFFLHLVFLPSRFSFNCESRYFQFLNGIGECLQSLKRNRPSPHISVYGLHWSQICLWMSLTALGKVLLSYFDSLLNFRGIVGLSVPPAESFGSASVGLHFLALVPLWFFFSSFFLQALISPLLTSTRLSSPSFHLFICSTSLSCSTCSDRKTTCW